MVSYLINGKRYWKIDLLEHGGDLLSRYLRETGKRRAEVSVYDLRTHFKINTYDDPSARALKMYLRHESMSVIRQHHHGKVRVKRGKQRYYQGGGRQQIYSIWE